MANVIAGTKKIVAGRLYRVENTNRPKLSNSSKEYFVTWVEDSDGKNERPWLITDNEIGNARHRANQNKEDQFCLCADGGPVMLLADVRIKKGRVISVWNQKRKHWKANNYYEGVVLQGIDGTSSECLLFTPTEIERIENRATRNSEDIPKKAFFSDLFS